jgi:hypothetical protein
MDSLPVGTRDQSDPRWAGAELIRLGSTADEIASLRRSAALICESEMRTVD